MARPLNKLAYSAPGAICLSFEQRNPDHRGDHRGKTMSSPAPASQPTPLQPLLVDTDRAEALKIESIDLPSLTLSQRQLCDLELLMNGGFTPLKGFMTEAEYRSVIEDMRLADGSLWPIPVTLDIPDQLAAKLAPGERIALRDNEGFMLAVLAVESLFKPDPRHEARRVYGTESARHPGVAHLLRERHETLVGGVVDGIQLPTHYDYEELRHTPSELRGLLAKLGWRRVMAFHTSRRCIACSAISPSKPPSRPTHTSCCIRWSGSPSRVT